MEINLLNQSAHLHSQAEKKPIDKGSANVGKKAFDSFIADVNPSSKSRALQKINSSSSVNKNGIDNAVKMKEASRAEKFMTEFLLSEVMLGEVLKPLDDNPAAKSVVGKVLLDNFVSGIFETEKPVQKPKGESL